MSCHKSKQAKIANPSHTLLSSCYYSVSVITYEKKNEISSLYLSLLTST